MSQPEAQLPPRRRDVRVECRAFMHRKLAAMRKRHGALGELFVLRLWCHVAASDPVHGRVYGTDPEETAARIMVGLQLTKGQGRALLTEAERIGLIHRDPTNTHHKVHEWFEYQGRFHANARLRAARGAAGRWRTRSAKQACLKHKTNAINESCLEHDRIDLELEPDASSITQTPSAGNASSKRRCLKHQAPLPSPSLPSPQTLTPSESVPARRRFRPPTLAEWVSFGRSIGWDDVEDMQSSYDHYVACGWKMAGGKAISCWEAAARNCQRRARRRREEQAQRRAGEGPARQRRFL